MNDEMSESGKELPLCHLHIPELAYPWPASGVRSSSSSCKKLFETATFLGTVGLQIKLHRCSLFRDWLRDDPWPQGDCWSSPFFAQQVTIYEQFSVDRMYPVSLQTKQASFPVSVHCSLRAIKSRNTLWQETTFFLCLQLHLKRSFVPHAQIARERHIEAAFKGGVHWAAFSFVLPWCICRLCLVPLDHFMPLPLLFSQWYKIYQCILSRHVTIRLICNVRVKLVM